MPFTKYRGSLPREEWDFSDLKPGEKRLCFYWEYLRASEIVKELHKQHLPKDRRHESAIFGMCSAILDRVAFLKGDTNSGLTNLHDIEQSKQVPAFAFDILSHEEFPDTAWQSLNKDQRKDMVDRAVAAATSAVNFHFELMPDDFVKFAAWRRGDGGRLPPNETAGILRIPVGLRAEDIVEAFDIQLNKFIKEHPTNFAPGFSASRGQYSDMLRLLGARRVVKAVGSEDAEAYTREHSFNRCALYSDPTDFRRAAKEAKVILERLVSSVGDR